MKLNLKFLQLRAKYGSEWSTIKLRGMKHKEQPRALRRRARTPKQKQGSCAQQEGLLHESCATSTPIHIYFYFQDIGACKTRIDYSCALNTAANKAPSAFVVWYGAFKQYRAWRRRSRSSDKYRHRGPSLCASCVASTPVQNPAFLRGYWGLRFDLIAM